MKLIEILKQKTTDARKSILESEETLALVERLKKAAVTQAEFGNSYERIVIQGRTEWFVDEIIKELEKEKLSITKWWSSDTCHITMSWGD